jgi:hypothetical protein
LKAKFCLVAVLLMFFSLIGIASVLVTPVAATDPVIVGKWDRTDGADKYTIYANGVTETVLPDGTHHGTWAYDGSSGYKYIFSWDFGPSGKAPFVDYVTVAADGQSYSGVNNYGDDFHCVRVGGADSTPAADSGFPVVPVAIGGVAAAIAAIGAAVYYFFIAGGGAESAAGGAGAAGGGGSVIDKEQNAFLRGSREVAESISEPGSNVQSPAAENKQFSSQEKNVDLSSSRKQETKSKAQNQPGQCDRPAYGEGLGDQNKPEPDFQVESDKSGSG